MLNKYLIAVLLLVCVGAVVFYVWQGGQIAQPGENEPGVENGVLSFETISQEIYGWDNKHEYLVIENSEEWNRVWSSGFPPDIDFSIYVVIATFMGGWSSGGHWISIDNITVMENEIIVSVKENYPGRTDVTGAGTFPHHIVKIERIQKPIVFEVQQFRVHTYDENMDPYDEIRYELVGEYRVEPDSGPPEP